MFRSAWLGLGALTLGVLAGCSAGPSELDTPEVVWPDGEPVGEFEDDPAVVALRAALVQEAVAWNALDYSDPDFVFRWGLAPDLIRGAEGWAEDAQRSFVLELSEPWEWSAPGPRALDVYDVEIDGDVSVVIACEGALVAGDSRPVLTSYRVELFGDGSSVIAWELPSDDADDLFWERCQASELVAGRFDPEPGPFDGHPEDIKPPAAAEDYGFDNVS